MKTYGKYTRNVVGKGVELDISIYLIYYYNHIFKRSVSVIDNDGKETLVNRTTPAEFFEDFLHRTQKEETDYQHDSFSKILADKELEKIQYRLEEKGIQLCPFNMYYLCEYIKFLTSDRYFVLLAPQIKDTLSEITDLSSITFTNKDGSSTTTSSDELKKAVLEALEAKSKETENNYTAIKMVKWNKVANNEIMQAIFVHELSAFLHSYFPIKRRANAIVTAPEQDLIIHFLNMFGLSPAPVTPARFRQLKGIYDKIQKYPSLINVPWGEDSKVHRCLEIDFVKYKFWKTGKLNFKDENLKLDETQVGDTIYFSKDFQFDLD